MANNISILFWLKRSRINKRGQAPLMLRISFRKQRREFSTGFNLEPDKWDVFRYRVKSKALEAVQINQYLDESKARILSIFREMTSDKELTLDRVADRFLGKDEQAVTLLQLVEFHNANFKLPSIDRQTGIVGGNGNPYIGPSIKFEPSAKPVAIPAAN